MSQRKPDLTDRQIETLQFIINFIQAHGQAPTYREIARGTNVTSPQNVYVMLRRMAARGYIEMPERCQARSIKVLKHPHF